MKARTAITSVVSFRFLRWFSQDIYLPSLPLLIATFHTTRERVQHSFLYFLIGILLSQVIGSSTLFLLGKRRILLIKMAISTAGALMIIFSTTIFPFNIGRLIQGLGIGLASSIASVMIHDAHHHHEQTRSKIASTLSHIGIYSAWFPYLAMLVGAVIYNWFDWQANFVFLIILYCGAALFVLRSIPQEQIHVKRLTWKDFRVYWACLQSPSYRRYSLSYVLISAGITAYFLASTFIFHLHYGLTPFSIAMLAVFPMVGQSLGKVVSVWSCKRFDHVRNMYLGLAFSVAGAIGLVGGYLVWDAYWFFPAGMLVYTMGASLIAPHVTTKVMALFEHNPISSLGLLAALMTIGKIVFGYASTWFHPTYPLGLALILLGLALLALLTFIRKRATA